MPLQKINLQINAFCLQCRKILGFLEKFKDEVYKVQAKHEAEQAQVKKLSQMFVDYENNILKEYLYSIDHHQSRKGLDGFMDMR